MLSSHDLAILRGAFGAAEGVLFSDAISPTEILSVLDFGPQRRCVFEAGVWPDYLWWDEQLTAYGKSETISIAFPNPYVKYAPTTVTIQCNEDGSPITKVVPASHEEAFRRGMAALLRLHSRGQRSAHHRRRRQCRCRAGRRDDPRHPSLMTQEVAIM